MSNTTGMTRPSGPEISGVDQPHACPPQFIAKTPKIGVIIEVNIQLETECDVDAKCPHAVFTGDVQPS